MMNPFENLLIGNIVVVRNVQKHSIASQRPTFFSLTILYVVKVCNSQAYKNMEMTKECISFTFDPKDILFSLQIGFTALKELQWLA